MSLASRSCFATAAAAAMLGAVLLFTGGAPAESPGLKPTPDEEPITPIPPPPPADPRKVALGELLFADPRLSHDETRSCSSCHDVQTNGADSNRRDLARDGSELPLNTSTVFNAALSFRLNWEGGFRTLEGQAQASLENRALMGSNLDEIVGRISADADLSRRFQEAYGSAPNRGLLLDAIATYERSLLTPGSRFDLWLNGDASALSAKEQSGYYLFKTLGCVSCHQGVNVGANFFERHGIFRPLASPKPEMLRVPSLRNVATTPPYFHDGSATTLERAVREMGDAQLDRTLTDEQISAVVAFLGTLTGVYRGHVVTRASP